MDIKTLQNLLKANSPEELQKKALEVLHLKIDLTILFLVDSSKPNITGYKLFKSYDDMLYYIARLPMTNGFVFYYKTDQTYYVGASFYEQGWKFQFDGTGITALGLYDNNSDSLDEWKSLDYDTKFHTDKIIKGAA